MSHSILLAALLLVGVAGGAVTAVAMGDDVSTSPTVTIEEEGSDRAVVTRSTSDIRCGLCGNSGSISRTYGAGGADDGGTTYGEYGAWLSFTRSFSVTLPRLRWEAYVTGLHATIQDESSDGTLNSWLGGLGIGYAPDLLSAWDGHLQAEVMPFVGLGRTRYHNTFTSTISGRTYDSRAEGQGPAIEYGLKVNLMWIFASGVELAAQIGYVEKRTALSGETTSVVDGAVLNGPFEAHDVLRGVRYGLFLGYRL